MKVYICFEEWEDEHGEEWASDIKKVYASKDDAHNWIKSWRERFDPLNGKITSVEDEHDGWFIVVNTEHHETFTYRCLEEEVE